MKTRLRSIIAGAVLTPVMMIGMAVALPSLPVYAQTTTTTETDTDTNTAACDTTTAVGVKKGIKCAKSDDQKSSLGVVIKNITNVLLFLIGAVSVIMIIIGGIRYVTSNGDSSQITGAKNTILYAVIGLIVALLAYAIVGFVVDSFVKP